MSVDLRAGVDYSLTRRHYDNIDYVAITINSTLTFYTIGGLAFLNNRKIFDVTKGWGLYIHGMDGLPPTGVPAPILALGIPVWQSPVPAFEGKRIQLRSNTRALVRFGNILNVPVEVPAQQTMEFFEKTFCVWVRAAPGATVGTLRLWAEG